MVIRKLKEFGRDIKRRTRKDKDTGYYLMMSNQLHPYIEATIITGAYGILGILWLAFPDIVLSRVFHCGTDFRNISIWKGWTFVGLSAVIIFIFLLRRLLQFEGALKNLEINLNKQKMIEKELNQMAYYDILTRLPNRFLLEERCKELTGNKNARFALVCMDVDNFKNINDTLGHQAGDQFLVYLSKRLIKYIGPNDFVARIGGDEFIIILGNIISREDTEKRLQYLLRILRNSWTYSRQNFNISVSMGAAIYPEHGDNLELLLRNSDIAMYAVKKNLKNNFGFYSEELNKRNIQHITMINELHRAIEKDEFMLLYQPIINLKSGKLIGVEALIRWVHPEQGIISPMDFIPLAEESGLIHDIEKWIIKTAFLQKKRWDEKLAGYQGLVMSINISGKSFIRYGFVNAIRNLLIQTGLNSNEIQLEITETVFIEKMNISQKVINDISNMGVLIALDDFGSGYSSLTYLKNLPIDIVKLDANFIKGIIKQGEDRVIVNSVIELTHDLGLRIVAEGIETEEQVSVLKQNQCDYGQGYLFNRPVSADQIEKMIKNQASLLCIS